MIAKERKTVLLALSWHFEALVRGVIAYAREHGWHLVFLRGHTEEGLKRWRGDGVITSLPANQMTCRAWHNIKIVSLVPLKGEPLKCSVVRENDYEIGRIAAEYFIRQGHVNFAVYSDTGRMEGFRDTLRKSGFQCSMLRPQNWIWRNEARILEWLGSLPKPVALLAENDWDASEIFNIAERNGVAVPSELSILDVGNDRLICMTPIIPLSSVNSRLYAVGRRAAQELDELLEGKPEAEETITVLPDPMIVERKSTDFLAVEEPRVMRIVNYLKESDAGTLISVKDLAQKFYVSESALYKLFVQHLNLSPKQFLAELRLKHACELLLSENLTMAAVAAQSGFPTACALFTAFRTRFHLSPGEWRKQNLEANRQYA